jgi:hypothetical protein
VTLSYEPPPSLSDVDDGAAVDGLDLESSEARWPCPWPERRRKTTTIRGL